MDYFRKYKKKIEEIVVIHNFSKHYILLAEELSDDFETYLQPVKEFRDAYEHIIRIFAKCPCDITDNADNTDNIKKDEYIRKNLDKALGHEYRAFFDVADWFCIVCRKRIYDIVQKYTFKELCKKYPKYPEMKAHLCTISIEIANIRETKDVDKHIFKTVNRYQKELVTLLAYYRELLNADL